MDSLELGSSLEKEVRASISIDERVFTANQEQQPELEAGKQIYSEPARCNVAPYETYILKELELGCREDEAHFSGDLATLRAIKEQYAQCVKARNDTYQSRRIVCLQSFQRFNQNWCNSRVRLGHRNAKQKRG